MKRKLNSFALKASVIAVQSAVLALAGTSMARADDSVEDLVRATNSVEVGISATDKNSYKFGEYSGLEKKGGHGVANFEVKRSAYDSDDTTSFRFTGTDLGLKTRNLSAEYAQQGKLRFTFGYDELVHNISDSFQTPYTGAGSNRLSLPANWATHASNCTVTGVGGVVGAVVGTAGCGNYYVVGSNAGANSTATPTGNAGAMTAAELADMGNVNLSTQRKKTDLALSLFLTQQWQFTASATHETKDGIQALGAASPGTTTGGQVTILNPIKYTTNQFNLNLAYTGDKAYGQATYYASLFKNAVQSILFENPYFSAATPAISSTGVVTYPYGTWGQMSSAPSNQFHQLSLSGGYNFDRTTKLQGGFSYSRTTQNDAFEPERAPGGATAAVTEPNSSLGGLVITKAANLKLYTKPVKDLALTAALKYDDRDNRTPVALYSWRDTDTQVAGANRQAYNWVYSRKQTQANFDADWTIVRGHAIKAGLELQQVSRTCNGTVWSSGCVNAADHRERTLGAEYRNSSVEGITGRLGYWQSIRKVAGYFDPNFIQVNTTQAPDVLTRFNMTDRNRDKFRAAADWQATEQLNLTLTLDVNSDRYRTGENPVGGYDLGLRNARSRVWNLDGVYRVTDAINLTGFYTREDKASLLAGSANNAAAANTMVAMWMVDMKDKVDTLGFGFKASEVGGKWDLSGDYVKSNATSPYGLFASSTLSFSTTTTNPTALLTANAFGNYAFPDTYEKSDMLRFGAKYPIDKNSSLRFGYSYQKLSSADPLRYNGLQTGTATSATSGSGTATVNGGNVTATQVYTNQQLFPTNEQAPNYKIQSFSVTYIYSFK